MSEESKAIKKITAEAAYKARLLGMEGALEMVKKCRTHREATRELEKWIAEIKKDKQSKSNPWEKFSTGLNSDD